MTKAEFKTAIDLSIGGTVGKVTKVRHKTANDVIADALYPSEKLELSTGAVTNTILDASPVVSGVTYAIFFKRVLNEVIVSGYFTNSSGSSIAGAAIIFNLIDVTYRVKPGGNHTIQGNKSTGPVLGIYLTDSSNSIRLTNPVSNGETVYLNGRYTCED